jgi:hypothetical protein
MQDNGATHQHRDGEPQEFLAQHIRDLLAEVADLKEAGGEDLTDTLAHWLTAHYVAAAKTAARNGRAEGIDLKTLRALSADVVALRRGDHYAERLNIERAQLELDRDQSKERMEKLFWEWATKPENKKSICASSLTADEKVERIRQIFHRDREEPRGGLSPEALQLIEKEAKLL